MIKWDKVVLKGNTITIIVNGTPYTGRLSNNQRFYHMKDHWQVCDYIFGNRSARDQINQEFNTVYGCFPECSNPRQFVKEYFKKYHTGKGECIDFDEEI